MQSLSQLRDQAQSIETIKLITQALGDIAALKLKERRVTVEQNIRFFHEIQELYRLVKFLAAKAKLEPKTKKAKEGRTIAVLLTSNQHFYGGLDQEVSRLYISQTQNLTCDRLVIGGMGKTLLTENKYPHQFESIIYTQEYPSLDELRTLAAKLFEYSKVLVFHNKFKTILTSSPAISDVSASDIAELDAHDAPYYIAEPDLDQMLEFFESQILILLFQSLFLEVDIIRLSARMVSMNTAGDNADKLYSEDKWHILEAKKHILNLEILNTYSGIIRKGKLGRG